MYLPSTLDSLAYRIPRMLLWLQEGRIHHLDCVDPRLNYMTPVWGLVNLPLFLWLGERSLFLTGFLSWLVSLVLFRHWALEVGIDEAKADWAAVICAATTFGVLQAASTTNDLLAAVLVLIALNAVVMFERSGRGGDILWAILALCLAAGVKPHFSVLVLPFVLWFWLSPSRPWRSLRWRLVPVLLPVWLLCSPVPSFVMNTLTYGSPTVMDQDPAFSGGHTLANLAAGSLMMGWSLMQPPVNPLAPWMSQPLADIEQFLGLQSAVPRFALVAQPVTMVEGASLGLVSSVLMGIGLWRAFRLGKAAWRDWPLWAFGVGLTGFLLAVAKVVPGTLGRSFAGFVLCAVPLAMVGMRTLSERTLKAGAWLCLWSCAAALVFNPARPLWPARWIHERVRDSGRQGRAVQLLAQYVDFRDRAEVGTDLVNRIPEEEKSLGVIAGGDESLAPLWRPHRLHRKVLLVEPDATLETLKAMPARYFILTGSGSQYFPELRRQIEADAGFQLVEERAYLTRLSSGMQPWRLYRRVEPGVSNE
jgi:hypothetical protein